MSQLPNNNPDTTSINPIAGSNLPQSWMVNPMYDSSQFHGANIYPQSFQGQSMYPQNYLNWIQTGYSHGVPFVPPSSIASSAAQFNSNNEESHLIEQQASRKRLAESSGEESEDDENQPPSKSPKQAKEEERQYLELDSGTHTAYTPYLSSSLNPLNQLNSLNPLAQSTPRGVSSYSYQHPTFNTPSAQLGMFSNQAFAAQFPHMNPQMLYNHYNSSPSTVYSSSVSTLPSVPHNFSSDSSSGQIQCTLSSLDSGLSSSGQSSKGSTALQRDIKGAALEGRTQFDVSGRLALLNSNQKYNVSVGEITRRLGAPENMNTSLLGAMLRRAKNKGGGTDLRETLAQYNIKLPEGRRRSLENTAFTAFVEAEAMKLANDFDQVLQEYFPTKLLLFEVALTFQRTYIHQQPTIANPRQTQNLFQLLEAIDSSNSDPDQQVDYILELLLFIMETICVVLERDRSLVDMGIETPESMYGQLPLPSDLQKGLTDFNLVTHNFGVKAVLAAYRSMCGQQLNPHKVEQFDSPDSSD